LYVSGRGTTRLSGATTSPSPRPAFNLTAVSNLTAVPTFPFFDRLLAALTGAAAGQLAPITEEEFATLPSFVQSQIEREFANDALSALKQCIIDTELKPAEVVLTPSQLRYKKILLAE
jgi:hypothetical protein